MPRLGDESDVAQHRLAKAEADILEGDAAMRLEVGQRAGLVLHLRLGPQHFGDALRRRLRAGKTDEQHTDHEDAGQHLRQVGVDGDDLADRQVALLDGSAAEPDDRRNADVEQQQQYRAGDGRQQHGADGAGRQVVVGVAEAPALVIFADEGFDDAHPGQILLNDGIDAVERLLHPHKQRVGALDDDPEHEQQRDQQREGDERQLGAGQEGHRQAADRNQRRAHEDAQGDEHHVLRLGDVVGQPRHQLAGAEYVQVAERERLNGAVDVIAQVCAKVEGGAHSEDGTADAADRADQREDDHQQAGFQHQRLVAAANAFIDDALHHARLHEVHRDFEDHQQRGEQGGFPVGFQVNEQGSHTDFLQ